jgi:Short C-terminal domain
VKLDAGAARAVAHRLHEWQAEKAHLASVTQVFDAFANAGGATVFRWLGVQVLVGDGTVYTLGFHDPATMTNTSRLLGPLAGAQAMVTDGSQAWSPGRAMFLPIALTGLATKTKADAAVVFLDGTVRMSALDGNYAVREAQKQVVQFNAMASAATPAAAPETSSDPATRLRKLQELLDAGLLTQDEYEAKRTEVINSI